MIGPQSSYCGELWHKMTGQLSLLFYGTRLTRRFKVGRYSTLLNLLCFIEPADVTISLVMRNRNMGSDAFLFQHRIDLRSPSEATLLHLPSRTPSISHLVLHLLPKYRATRERAGLFHHVTKTQPQVFNVLLKSTHWIYL